MTEDVDAIAADLSFGPAYYLADCYSWGLTVTECHPSIAWRRAMRDLAELGLIRSEPCVPFYVITELGRRVRAALKELREAERALHGRR